VNRRLLNTLPPDEVDVMIQRAEQAEGDEMRSYGGKKHEQRWLWLAINPQTGKVLAYVCGRRTDEAFLQ
jgi:insertion element IS1 protein InsB